jgi:squalene-associated FAD-dependent desaturase
MREQFTPSPDPSRLKEEATGVPCAQRKVAVVGGGWAGCAAAVELARRGAAVTLFEAARTLGGRARQVEINGLALDNGQHILLGAYDETLRLFQLLEIDPDAVLLRLPLQLRYPSGSGMDFITPRLPAPLHVLAALLRARGLAFGDKLSLARFSTTARWMDWRLHRDCSVAELLARFDQTDRLIRLLWRPLCIAALNTPPERASAQVFLNVLRDSLGARRAASDMLIPKVDLTRMLPQQAAAFVERNGGRVRTGATVNRIERTERGWRVTVNGMEENAESFDAIVVATPPKQAAALLAGHADVAALSSFEYEPISTCYLQYDRGLRLPQPFCALVDDPAAGLWGQFAFDRGQLAAGQDGLLAVVVSTSGEALALGQEALAAALAQQLASAFGRAELAKPQWVKLIAEKRATFSCTPGLTRPVNGIGCAGLAIAGDYTASDYPATLETAVRSGMQAAACLLG